MRIARVARPGPRGPEARTVVVNLNAGVVIDAQRAEQVRLERLGNSPSAALRLAEAKIPGSLAEGLGSTRFLDDLGVAAGADPPDDALIPLQGVRWLPALDPPRYRDFMSFEQHHLSVRHALGREVPAVTYELPTYYKGGHLTLIGHDEELAWPGYSEWMDYELELGFVVGRGGVDLRPDEAERCLFGVTLLNDFSARDRQFHENQGNLGPAKGKDFATALGPWITTVDELDLLRIEMVARVNGEEWARGASGSAMWSVGEILAYLSTAEPLHPGELVGSGTLGGGSALEVGRRLVPGDEVELEATGLGKLRTRLAAADSVRWSPLRRTPGRPIDGCSPVGISERMPPRPGIPELPLG